jgi:ABC-type multidrug transport system fused ATPase/permease subunit
LHEEEALGKAYDAQLLARLWHYVAPYRTQVLLTIVLVAPIFLIGELSPPWIIKTGLDRVFGTEAALQSRAGPEWLASILEPPSGIAPLAWLALLYLMAMLAGTLLQYAHLLLMVVTGQSAMRDLRRNVFAHIQKLHLGFFDRYPVGRLVTRASNDVEHIAEMFSSGIVALVTDVLKMLGFATVLFWLNPRLALVTFLVVPFLAVVAITFRLKIRTAFRAVRVRIARINAMLQETVTGMKIVQLFTQEERHRRDFDVLNGAHRDAWLHSIRYEAALFSVVEIAGGISVAIIIGYGTGIASSGELYFFIDVMRRFFQPLRDLSAKFSVMQSAMASSERIFQLLDTPPAVVDQPEAARPVPSPQRSRSRGAVEFQNVWFAYRGREWVLRDVSFRVEPGERIALVGSTGAGKTSAIKLLTRLYEVNRGRILLDGVDLRELPQRELRRRIAMVLQDVFVFSGSVADNVSLGRPEVDAVAIERATRAVEAHRFIERLPQGYRTVLRERGGDVSTGQRQLLSFARALAHGADVLVLDEATSSVDPETEEAVQRGIHALMQGKTALVIAHRLSTIQDVDRIYVLHRGRVVEEGRHEELLAADGIYRRLYRLQFHGAREWKGARAAV